jgi:hypothetical protein
MASHDYKHSNTSLDGIDRESKRTLIRVAGLIKEKDILPASRYGVSSNMQRIPLSKSRRQLLKLMQRIKFGKIEGLIIHNGDPVLEPAPKVIREIKLGSKEDRKSVPIENGLLEKPQVIELLGRLSHLGSGTIQSLEIQHGLPFRIRIEDST